MRVAEVSLPAIRRNVRHLRDLTGSELIAVIKANGYGHDAEIVARAAVEGGAKLLGVTDLEEALSLRAAGISAPVLCWLHGARADFEAAVLGGIEIGVSHLAQLEAVAESARETGRVATIHLKLDTGLSRNGAAPEEWDELFARAVQLEREGLLRVRGVFSHLANAGLDADLAQAERLDAGVALLREAGCDPEMVHLAASAAALSRPELRRYNTVRVGMAVYGLSPFADRTSAELGLVPAMTLKSEIVALRQVSAGTGVSYGYNHIVQSDTTLGLVPIGYADGMPRALNGRGATVAVRGQHCPIVGRIGMDQCILDLGKLGKKVRIGDPVVLFGDPADGVPPVETWAEVMGAINYEIVAGIGSRVVRVPVDGEDPPVPSQSTNVGGRAEPADSERSSRAIVRVDDPETMHELGARLGRALAAGDLVILTGPLGAGKTTLSRGIGEGLGVRGPVTSPTFVLARTHPSRTGGPPLVHLDAYRLTDAAELDDLDIDFEGSVVLAEWGRGMVEPGESWIEIEIERPTGASEREAPAHLGAALGVEALNADAAEYEAAEELVEPRTVTITGYGERWAGGVPS